jgi:hypothetical protein
LPSCAEKVWVRRSRLKTSSSKERPPAAAVSKAGRYAVPEAGRGILGSVVPPQDEEPVARGRGLERLQQAAVEPEVRRYQRDGAILAAAVLADPVRDCHEGVGENGAAEGLGCGGAADHGRDAVRARDDLELEIYRKGRRLYRRPVAAWARRTYALDWIGRVARARREIVFVLVSSTWPDRFLFGDKLNRIGLLRILLFAFLT